MWGWLAASPSPNPVTRGSAQAAARAELSKRAYHRNDPSVVDRGLEWLLKRLQKVLDASTRHAPGHGVGLFLIIVIVAAVVALIVARVGALRRTARASDLRVRRDHRRRSSQGSGPIGG
jgi:hypothetical protein